MDPSDPNIFIEVLEVVGGHCIWDMKWSEPSMSTGAPFGQPLGTPYPVFPWNRSISWSWPTHIHQCNIVEKYKKHISFNSETTSKSLEGSQTVNNCFV